MGWKPRGHRSITDEVRVSVRTRQKDLRSAWSQFQTGFPPRKKLGMSRDSYHSNPHSGSSEDTEEELNIARGKRIHIGRPEPFAQFNAAVLDDWDRLGFTADILFRS